MATSQAQIDQVAKSFTDFYYQTFSTNRANLKPLYRDPSMLSFEGSQLQGTEAIANKLTSLPFQTVRHKISTVDAQPSHPQNGTIIVMVTGQILVDGETNPQQFSQVFHLYPDGPSNYFVLNDVFRLCYA